MIVWRSFVACAASFVMLAPYASMAQATISSGYVNPDDLTQKLLAQTNFTATVAIVNGQKIRLAMPLSEQGTAATDGAVQTAVSTIQQFTVLCPQTRIQEVVVHHGPDIVSQPTNFVSGSNAVIWLKTDDLHYAQFCFQLSHEYCHVLARTWTALNQKRYQTQWFDESLCECASLMLLNRVGQKWSTAPPAPAYGKDSHLYLDYVKVLLRPQYCLPPSMPLSVWYKQNHRLLETDWPNGLPKPTATMPGYDMAPPTISNSRARVRLVANRLYTLFQKHPEGWKAVPYLHTKPIPANASFQQFLTAWHDAVPPDEKNFVGQVASAFGISIK